MTWKDKLEIGLNEDAPYRKDNVPESEAGGPAIPSGPGRSPEIPLARGVQKVKARTAPGKVRRVVPVRSSPATRKA